MGAKSVTKGFFMLNLFFCVNLGSIHKTDTHQALKTFLTKKSIFETQENNPRSLVLFTLKTQSSTSL